MKNLLVVESPTKAKTIGKYLGNQFEVVATIGHLRDLPKNKMAVDLKDFTPEYVVDTEKKKVVDQLLSASKKADKILLASDPDREGEAIAWHVKTILENPETVKKAKKPTYAKASAGEEELNISRVTFHEITKEAIKEAMEHPREIDMNLVDAQQGRRVLDRVVGYSLSPILWRKVRRGLSAGRVQSVAVRLICEREKEIENFKKEKYYSVSAELNGIASSLKAPRNDTFVADLIKADGKNIYKTEKLKLFDGNYSYTKTIFDNREKVEKFISELAADFKVEKINGREVSRSPLPAFTTSKLQQNAARKFGWSGKQTMGVAQKLYEKGLITYHRTDSVYLSEKAITEFRKFIEEKYGKNYVAEKVRVYKNNSKNAQEAHEAIRPTNANLIPDGAAFAESFGEPKEKKLYEMIWKRAVATQAASAKMENTTVDFSNGNGIFQSKGVRMLFDGFLRITQEKHEDQILPELKEGEDLKSKKISFEEQETNPPPRYTDASLVSSLEKQGIGRPSTYAPIISTIQLRQYVEKDEGKFHPTNLGMAANEFLVKNFPDILSLPFTANMEEDLDKVSLGKLDWKKMMKDFYSKFEKDLESVSKNSERVKVETEKLGEKCPQCKEGDLVVRVGRFGKFVSCDRFPECKFTKPFTETAGFKCPECGAEGVVKKTKTGRKFFGCSRYPECKWAGWKKP